MSRFFLAVVLLCMGSDSQAQVQQSGSSRKVELDHGISIAYPASWRVLPKAFSNATELVALRSRERGAAPSARTVVTTERQLDHDAAVQRLADIAAETIVPVKYRTIAGWPALERRHVSPLDRAGQGAQQLGDDLALGLTTAIAAGDVLVRIETTLLDGAATRLARVRSERTASQAVSIGRSLAVPMQGRPAEATKAIEALRAKTRARSPSAPAASPREGTLHNQLRVPDGTNLTPVAVPLMFGELEIAASKDGQHIVIASNHGVAVSHNGRPFSFKGSPLPFERRGDPSVAVGASGTFYAAYIGLPDGQPASQGVTGCTTAISRSTDNGDTFEFLSHAVRCPKDGPNQCFPDQAHIAVDPVNTGDSATDQIYAVYRKCERTDPAERECKDTIRWCRGRPSIVCSKDGGSSWSSPQVIEGARDADFPKVTVSTDGTVYVVYRSADLLKLTKYSSCKDGLSRQAGFPVVIPMTGYRACNPDQLIDRCHCPIAGLDRCHRGNLLSSPMVAVDDRNPAHVYVAFAVNTDTANDNIMIKASIDGGKTWPAQQGVILNTPKPARRFMPWVCSTTGRAYVTWYDRRAMTEQDNDLTDYFVGMATLDAGGLRAGPEIKLTTRPDPQCGIGSAPGGIWPGGVRDPSDSESCSRQPQFGGVCAPSGGPCDFACRPNETCFPSCDRGRTCQAAAGRPKYGDYNGNACAAGTIFAAWASATTLAGMQEDAIRIYAVTLPAYGPP